MTRIATYLTAAAATVLLTGLMTGCSSDSSDTASPTSTVTVSASSSAEPNAGDAEASEATDGQATDTIEADETANAQQPSSPQPAANFADGNGYGFSSPTGKIVCRGANDRLICQTANQRHTVSVDALCGFYAGEEQGRAVQFGYFADKTRPCATIIQGNFFTAPRALDYGQSVVFSIDSGIRVTCSSAPAGLTCRDSGGSGFFLSGESFRTL